MHDFLTALKSLIIHKSLTNIANDLLKNRRAIYNALQRNFVAGVVRYVLSSGVRSAEQRWRKLNCNRNDLAAKSLRRIKIVN